MRSPVQSRVSLLKRRKLKDYLRFLFYYHILLSHWNYRVIFAFLLATI